MDGYKVEIDGKEYRLPEDLDLNDAVEAEQKQDELGPMGLVRFMVWRVLLREDPEITLEQAGAKVSMASLIDDEVEEAPPPIPLLEPEAQSGTSGGGGNGSGSTEADVQLRTQGISGPR